MRKPEIQMSGDELREAAAKTSDGDKAAARRARVELKRRAAKRAAKLTPVTPIKAKAAKTTRTPAYKAAMAEAKRTAERQSIAAGGGFVKLHIAARAAAKAGLDAQDLRLIDAA